MVRDVFDTHTIVVENDSGADVPFLYNSDTQITGPHDSIEGLADEAGSRVRVTYSSHGDADVAVGVEVLAGPIPNR